MESLRHLVFGLFRRKLLEGVVDRLVRRAYSVEAILADGSCGEHVFISRWILAVEIGWVNYCIVWIHGFLLHHELMNLSIHQIMP